jgi:hypothetical protein
MEGILQKDKTKCFICKQNANGDFLAKHHCFEGALRSKSEEYGLTIYIHNNKCHIYGEYAVHRNANVARQVKAYAQKIAMKHYQWDEETFREIFKKSYI